MRYLWYSSPCGSNSPYQCPVYAKVKPLGKLSGEQTRWVETKKTLRDQLKALPQQMLLAAAFMTYLAKTPEDARESATREWIDIVDDARTASAT